MISVFSNELIYSQNFHHAGNDSYSHSKISSRPEVVSKLCTVSEQLLRAELTSGWITRLCYPNTWKDANLNHRKPNGALSWESSAYCKTCTILLRKTRRPLTFITINSGSPTWNNSSLKVDPEVAFHLCCHELRRTFKDLSSSALEKNCSVDYLEKEFGLRKSLPEHVVSGVKAKNFKKMLQQQFKKGPALVEPACTFKFLEILRSEHRYDRKMFSCWLQILT